MRSEDWLNAPQGPVSDFLFASPAVSTREGCWGEEIWCSSLRLLCILGRQWGIAAPYWPFDLTRPLCTDYTCFQRLPDHYYHDVSGKPIMWSCHRHLFEPPWLLLNHFCQWLKVQTEKLLSENCVIFVFFIFFSVFFLWWYHFVHIHNRSVIVFFQWQHDDNHKKLKAETIMSLQLGPID